MRESNPSSIYANDLAGTKISSPSIFFGRGFGKGSFLKIGTTIHNKYRAYILALLIKGEGFLIF